jgi:hypothetical protein
VRASAFERKAHNGAARDGTDGGRFESRSARATTRARWDHLACGHAQSGTYTRASRASIAPSRITDPGHGRLLYL